MTPYNRLSAAMLKRRKKSEFQSAYVSFVNISQLCVKFQTNQSSNGSSIQW